MAKGDGFFRENQLSNERYNKYLGQQKSIAMAEEMDEKDKRHEKKEYLPKEKTCFNCDNKRSCKTFKSRSTAVSGAASVGGDDKYTCEKWKSQKDPQVMDHKKAQSLLKQFAKMK